MAPLVLIKQMGAMKGQMRLGLRTLLLPDILFKALLSPGDACSTAKLQDALAI